MVGSITDINTRAAIIAQNKYSNDLNGYGVNHPNALSDGDDFGKGENNNQVGSQTDINNRLDNQARNIYSENNSYSLVHPNAISDGDEKGRAENNNSVGTSKDINERNQSIARNQYSGNSGYPDF